MNARDRLARALVATARRAVRMGLQSYFGGNLSVRLGAFVAGADSFLVKKSGVGFSECRPKDFIEVDSAGRPMGTSEKPTKEIYFHLGIYRARPDVNAVVHVHPPWSVAAGEAFAEFPLSTDQARTRLGRVPLVAAEPAGSGALADKVTEAFTSKGGRGASAAILRQHGVVCVGGSLQEAQHIAELLEESAKVAILVSVLGVQTPQP